MTVRLAPPKSQFLSQVDLPDHSLQDEITDSRGDAADTVHEVQEFLDETTGGRCMIVHAKNSGADVHIST